MDALLPLPLLLMKRYGMPFVTLFIPVELKVSDLIHSQALSLRGLYLVCCYLQFTILKY